MKRISASLRNIRLTLTIMMLTAGLMTAASNLNAKIVTENIEYKQGKIILEGFIAYDDELKGKRPGVLIVHQWMGLKDYEKMRSRQIAGTVSFHGNYDTPNPDDAK